MHLDSKLHYAERGSIAVCERNAEHVKSRSRIEMLQKLRQSAVFIGVTLLELYAYAACKNFSQRIFSNNALRLES